MLDQLSARRGHLQATAAGQKRSVPKTLSPQSSPSHNVVHDEKHTVLKILCDRGNAIEASSRYYEKTPQ